MREKKIIKTYLKSLGITAITTVSLLLADKLEAKPSPGDSYQNILVAQEAFPLPKTEHPVWIEQPSGHRLVFSDYSIQDDAIVLMGDILYPSGLQAHASLAFMCNHEQEALLAVGELTSDAFLVEHTQTLPAIYVKVFRDSYCQQ